MRTAIVLFWTLVACGVPMWAAQSAATKFPPATADLSQGAYERIDALSQAEFAKHAAAGVTIGIVSPKGLEWTKSYGLADLEKKTPASRDTVYRIGTITKQFTALMLLQLVERGKVSLSDPVERYVPEINQIPGKYPNAAPITLLQLAMHTSGLCRQPDDEETYARGSASEWEKTLLAAFPHAKYVAEPGTRFVYSGFGYALLGLALSRAAGKSYTEYMRENVFAPLGMRHSDVEPTSAIQPALAVGYEIKDGKPDSGKSAEELRGRGYNLPNDAIFTTVDDMAKFMALQMLGGPESVLKKQTVKDNLSHGFFAFSNFSGAVGIGYQTGRFPEYSDLIIDGHGGQVAGYRAQAYFRPDAEVGVIVMGNAEDVGRNTENGFNLDYVLRCLSALAH